MRFAGHGPLEKALIRVTRDISISEDELQEDFVRASGPGGQKVNKVASAVQLRFDAGNSPNLPDDVRRRLLRIAGSRATESGEIIVESQRHRSQERNREEARRRLFELIRRAAQKPKRRRRTRPTRASRERRIQDKKAQSKRKQLRKRPRRGEE